MSRRPNRTGQGLPSRACRVLVFTNILSPYRIPLFEAIAIQPGIELEVVLLAENEADRQWQIERATPTFRSNVLNGLHWFVPGRELHVHLNWGVHRTIKRVKPDVIVVSGYDSPAYRSALLWSGVYRIPLILWFESSLFSAKHKRGVVAAAKRFFVRRAAACVAFGTKARECLEALGVPPSKVFTGLNTVDVQRYAAQASLLRQEPSFQAERATYPSVMFLYVGRLIRGKNVKALLEVLARLDDPGLGLFIVGDGPLRHAMEAYCGAHGQRNVYFEGFKQQDDLVGYYGLADVLVLPSTQEVWGLVVNEALAAGLYVLCSDRAGAAYDLIRDGWNGRVFDPSDVDHLAKLVRETEEQIEDIRARREAISEHACREFSIERAAKAFLEAIRAVTEERM